MKMIKVERCSVYPIGKKRAKWFTSANWQYSRDTKKLLDKLFKEQYPNKLHTRGEYYVRVDDESLLTKNDISLAKITEEVAEAVTKNM
jgi:hypothetical protein